MKTVLFVLPLLLTATSAFAQETKLSCAGVQTEEWSIEGTYGGAKIELFDNDSWTVFNYVMDLESYPVQMVYEEEGNSENTIVVRGTTSPEQATTTAIYRDANGLVEDFACQLSK